MIRIGEIEIHLISDGVVMMDSGGPWGLVPRALWSKYLAPDDQHRVPMILTCLLVRAAGQTIVVDTGLGDKLGEREIAIWGLERASGTLLDGLARVSVDVLTTPGSASTARPATLQFTLLMQDGRLVLKKLRTFFDDDNAVFDEELVDNMLATVEETITDLLFEQAGGAEARFSIADVTIAPGGIAIQVVTIP